MFSKKLFATAMVTALAFVASHAAAATVGQLGILDTSGINPATGVQWAAGDQYRLVFISSERVDNNLSNDIADWNAAAQGFADTAGLGGTWKIIGSTEDVDARDNTATNPNVNGTGHAIILIDGSTVIANDFNELWGGEIQNTILTTEKGTSIDDENSIPWPLTGTTAAGVKKGTLFLRDGGGAISQGEATTTTGWIDRANRTVTASSSNDHAIYAMSDALTVVPEPGSLALLGLGGLLIARRRRG